MIRVGPDRTHYIKFISLRTPGAYNFCIPLGMLRCPDPSGRKDVQQLNPGVLRRGVQAEAQRGLRPGAGSDHHQQGLRLQAQAR